MSWFQTAIVSCIAALAVAIQESQPTALVRGQAPQPAAPPVFRTEVVVTPERAPDDPGRLPVSTAVLTREQIERLPAMTLADVVRALPGFHVVLGTSSGFLPAAIARGFFGGGEAEYVKLLVDGIPVADAESGVADWQSVPVFALERVEAVRGPASAVYGDTALGGVVQAFTSASSHSRGALAVTGGSFGTRSLGGELHQPVGSASLGLIASYSGRDGFRSSSDLKEGFGSGSFVRVGNATRWSARGSYVYRTREEPGALSAAQLETSRRTSDPLFEEDRDTSRTANGAVRFDATRGALDASLLGYVRGRGGERVRTLLLAPAVGDPAYREIETLTAGLSQENSLDVTLAGTSGHLRFGVDASRTSVTTAYRSWDRRGAGAEIGSLDAHRQQFAAYVTQSVDVGGQARLHGGIRWDALEDRLVDGTRASHRAWSPRFGAAVLLGEAAQSITAFGQVSRAFKAATVDQLFDPRPFPDLQGGTLRVSNPRLEPQRGTSVEAGLRQSTGRHHWELLLYRMRMTNEIDFDPATFTYANIGRSTHAGAEIHAGLFRGERVSVAAHYAWTLVSPDQPRTHDLQLKNIPRHLFRPELTLLLPGRTMVHARYTRTAGTFADDQNLFPLRDRSTIDVRLARRLQRFTARVDLLNVTGRRYEEVGFVLTDFTGNVVPFYYPAQGFSITAGLELAFQRER